MANSTPEAAPKVVKIQRFQISLNILIQTLVFLGIVVMINYLSFRHNKRWDYSRDHKYALSSQTRAVLKDLKKPVQAIIFFSGAAEIRPDVYALLREYEAASDKMFKTEVVDPFRNFSRAQELQNKYKFGTSENILILDLDGKSKFVNAAEMVDVEEPDKIRAMMGQTEPRIKAFKGEQAVTGALLQLKESKPSKIYYAIGHGETPLESPELKYFNETIKRQNIEIAPLTLLNATSIPEDCRTLLINGPTRDLSEFELKLIDNFWTKNGRVYVLLNSFAETPRLNSLLAFQGIIPTHDRVIRVGTFLQYDEQGKPQLVSGPVPDPVFVVADSKTKITKDLAGQSGKFLGATQSLQIDDAQKLIAKTKIATLIQSGEGFWGETEEANKDQQAFFDPKKDRMGPLTLAAAVEKGAVEDRRVKMDSSRMVVVGNPELLTAGGARNSGGISIDFTVSALNWLLDREELIGIAPKEKSEVVMNLNDAQLNNIALIVMGMIPGFIAIFGFLNWWQRRS